MRNYRTVSVPERAHPLVKALYAEMARRRITVRALAERSGVNKDAIGDWRWRTSPTVSNLEACFNVVGLTLIPFPLDPNA